MKVVVTQVKSTINVQREHRGTIRALGLGRIGKSRVHEDSPSLRGMLHQVGYLVRVEEQEATSD
jgi:large subunit ribosomal protein L30